MKQLINVPAVAVAEGAAGRSGGGATALAEKICPAAAGSDLSLPELVERGEKVSRQGCFGVL